MLIENPDLLKSWLTSCLDPLCDADPAALAKYVLALIKKDKPEKELRQSMQAQMEVFLQNETPGFIDLLFETVENGRYLQHTPTTPEKPTPIVKSELPDPNDEPPADGVADSTTPTRLPASEVTHPDHEAPVQAGQRSPSSEFMKNRIRVRRRSSRSPVSAHRRRNSSRNRYRSRSSRSRSPPTSGHYRPTRSSRSRSPYRRTSRPHRPRSFSPPNNAPEDEGPSPYLPSTTAKRPRCRDYDEKGFCMRGDMCKFDHGNDAVVLEDTVVPGASSGVPAYQPSSVTSVYAEPYVPTGHPPVSLPPLHIPPPGYNPGGNARKRGLDDHHTAYPPAKQSVHDRLGAYNRAHRGGRGSRGRGGRGGGVHHVGSGGSGSTQIAVRNIPPEMNNIAHLNNHFARFGSLVNIQVQFEDDPGSALVTFSNPEDAGTAYNSPDAVLSNRFIKMHFYYNRDEGHKFGGHKSNPRQEVQVEEPEKTPEEIEAQEKRKAEEKAAAIAAVKKNQEMLEQKTRLKREQEEKQKENYKKVIELHKSKQDLLQKLINEQKNVIETIESKKGSLKPEEKASMMAVVKQLSASIEKAREDVKQMMQVVSPRKGPGELQKALLDAELELFQAQQDGSESVESIQRRVNQLRVESAKTGNLPTSHSHRGGMRGGFRGRVRGYFAPRFRGGRGRGRGARGFMGAGVTTVDRRPTKIQVSGYEIDEKDVAVDHFRKFGEVIALSDEEGDDHFTVQYKTRREAEMAFKNGKYFGDKELSLSWSANPVPDELSSEVVSNHESVVESDAADLDHEDGYTPLDPHYLPPGLDDHQAVKAGGGTHHGSKDDDDLDDAQKTEYTAEEADQLLYAEEEEDEEDEEAEDDRSWKR
ncbi:zinc finger protein swm-like [Tigriopus californicus]|uniref:zinc finger protein swm-like n=1 Tax=Tigriopus californicus TaxID=6832 RepID=UPI0027DA8CE3|nr:zinc finger protein swm-like [Tigriopus californicus]